MPSIHEDQSTAEKIHPQPGQPLPRPQRRRHRTKADRSLPPDDELKRLAREYLQRQHKHWPELVKAGLLLEISDTAIKAMVEDFKARHRGGPVDGELLQLLAKCRTKLAGNYNRYSCDNSDPKSVIDQMINCLDKARSEDRFVPWCYVFADYSMSGLDSSRQGYSSYKELLSAKQHVLDTTYIDDFTRASRDELEWWRLAAHSKRLFKRLIGASDGFDLNNVNWDIQVTVFGLLSRLFIRGLSQKVVRGMKGTARTGGSLGKPPLGFTLKIKQDEHGNVLVGRNGKQKKEPCWDPTTKDDAIRAFESFVVQSRSSYWVTKDFNARKVDGWDGWSPGGIKRLLRNPAYIGVFIWNKTRREFDFDKESWVVVKNPRTEWEVYYNPELALIPMTWWRTARRKLAAARRASPITGRKPSRNQISATTLFSGTLFCEYCGSEVKLLRSAGPYKVMGCLSGSTGARNCRLTTTKSTRIIEDCLLRYLRDTILTESRIQALVAEVNARVEQDARKPPVDTAAWKTELRRKQARIRKLVIHIENEPDPKSCVAYHERIKELQKEVNELNTEIAAAEGRRRTAPTPLSLDVAKQYLLEFRNTLNEAIPAAAEAIRLLTGPIKIRHERIPGRKRGARWIATFGLDLIRVFRHLQRDELKGSFDALGNASDVSLVEVPIERIPKYEALAPEFKRLRKKGASISTIASAHRMSRKYAAEILRFAETGERPQWKAGRRTGNGPKPKYLQIVDAVTRLRDRGNAPFEKIAAQLGVSKNTVKRAYDHAHVHIFREAAERGETPRRGRYSHLGEDLFDRVRQLLLAGKKPKDIAVELGCSVGTVNRTRRAMQEVVGKNSDESPTTPS
jgi:DNA-binding CsgD family transcriptional regulator